MSVYGWFQGKGPSGFGHNSTSDEVTEGLDLSGRSYLLTGCNSGIGLDTLRVLLHRGARVFAAARTEQKAADALARFDGEGIPIPCELSDPQSVRSAVQAVREAGFPLSGIIANAGIMALPERTVRLGHELQFLTNHLGHFILVTGLLEQLDDEGRVVMLSSSAHRGAPPEGIRFEDVSFEQGYSPWKAYGQSKLANLLFAKHLSTRLPQGGQRAHSVHPGVISTGLKRHMNPAVQAVLGTLGPALVLKSVPQGAATQVYVATHPDAAHSNGEFWADCNLATASEKGRDAGLAARLWDATEEWVAGL